MIEEIASQVAEKMDLKDWKCSAVISDFNKYGLEPSHKFILRITDSKDKWDFFIKICKDPHLTDFVINEAKALEYLNGLGIKGVPNLVLRGSENGKEFVVESFIQGKKVRHPSESMDVARNWLLNLYSKTKNGFIPGEELVDRAAKYADYLAKWFDLGDAANLIERYLPKDPLPSVFVHGDFWYENMLLTNGGIGVVDFSLSADNQPPLDIFTLILEDPTTLASSEKIRALTMDILPRGVDPYFLLIYTTLRRAVQIMQVMQDLYDNLLAFDTRMSLKGALPLVELLKNLAKKSTN